MRTIGGFTDRRIHVTLFEGAFDLGVMGGAEQRVYQEMLRLYEMETPLVTFERLASPHKLGRGESRLEHPEAMWTIFEDLCRRLALEEQGQSELVEELTPWRPQESRARFEAAVDWRPAPRPGVPVRRKTPVEAVV